jgi:hypothetical protein
MHKCHLCENEGYLWGLAGGPLFCESCMLSILREVCERRLIDSIVTSIRAKRAAWAQLAADSKKAGKP